MFARGFGSLGDVAVNDLSQRDILRSLPEYMNNHLCLFSIYRVGYAQRWTTGQRARQTHKRQVSHEA